jgi:hypothetical protein
MQGFQALSVLRFFLICAHLYFQLKGGQTKGLTAFSIYARKAVQATLLSKEGILDRNIAKEFRDKH